MIDRYRMISPSRKHRSPYDAQGETVCGWLCVEWRRNHIAAAPRWWRFGVQIVAGSRPRVVARRALCSCCALYVWPCVVWRRSWCYVRRYNGACNGVRGSAGVRHASACRYASGVIRGYALPSRVSPTPTRTNKRGVERCVMGRCDVM